MSSQRCGAQWPGNEQGLHSSCVDSTRVCGDPKEPPGANDACGQEALFSGEHLGWKSDPGSSPAFLLGIPAPCLHPGGQSGRCGDARGQGGVLPGGWPAACALLLLPGHLLPSPPLLVHDSDLECWGPSTGPQSTGRGSPASPAVSLGLGHDWVLCPKQPCLARPSCGHVSLWPNLFGAFFSVPPVPFLLWSQWSPGSAQSGLTDHQTPARHCFP